MELALNKHAFLWSKEIKKMRKYNWVHEGKRILAAGMAAAMMTGMTVPAFAASAEVAAETQADQAEIQQKAPVSEPYAAANTQGGWFSPERNMVSANQDAFRAFKKAKKNLLGVDYKMLMLLEKQVVAGTNYCIFARAKTVVPNAKPYYVLMYLYEDLKGNVEVTKIKKVAETNELDGGWFAPKSNGIHAKENADAMKAAKKALYGMVGAEMRILSVLGSQVVAGTNYCYLLRSTGTYPGAEPEYELMYVYQDLKGKCEVTDSKDLKI